MDTSHFTMIDNEAEHQYEAHDGDRVAGVVTYADRGAARVVLHTEVNPGYEGRGIGSLLAKFVLDDIRSACRTVVPKCPFVAAYIERHPEYQDIVENA